MISSAQLKVNLRPLWSPAAAAISALGSRFGDLVWKLLFSELQLVTADKYPIIGSDQTHEASEDSSSEQGQGGEGSDQTEDEVDPWEEERSWRDPSAHNIRSIVWMYNGQATHNGTFKVNLTCLFFQYITDRSFFRMNDQRTGWTYVLTNINCSLLLGSAHHWWKSTTGI